MKLTSTGKSLSEALIFVANNPLYDKRLFIELQVQYMKTTSSEHVSANVLPAESTHECLQTKSKDN